MIGKILIYNPQITKQKLYQLITQFNYDVSSNQLWKEYQSKGLLVQLNQNSDQAIILLDQLQYKELLQLDKLILEDCFKGWKNFILLKEFFLNDYNPNIQFTFCSYLQYKLKVGSIEPQKNENIFAMSQIQTFFDFIISNKLLTLIKENYENLGIVIKSYRNFMKNDIQFNERIKSTIYNSEIKKMLLNFKQYLVNTQNIIKIMRLNSRKQNYQIKQHKESNELNNFSQLKYLMKVLEQILSSHVQEFNYMMGDENSKLEIQNLWTDERIYIQMELERLKLKNQFLDNLKKKLLTQLTLFLDQKNFLNAASSLIQVIKNSWIEFEQQEQQEISSLQINNNVTLFFENQLNNLYLDYEEMNKELNNENNESLIFLKEIIQIKYEIGALLNPENPKEIKGLIKYIQNLRFKNQKFHLKLDSIKKSFLNVLPQINPKELQKLKEFINLNEFLLSVLQHQLFSTHLEAFSSDLIFSNYYNIQDLILFFLTRLNQMANYLILTLINFQSDLELNHFIFSFRYSNRRQIGKKKLFRKKQLFFCERTIKDYPQRIISIRNIEKQATYELINLQFTEQDYKNKLSKQKGLIEYFQFILSIEKQKISWEELDLRLIEREFGEIFIKESHFEMIVEKFIQDLNIDQLLENFIEDQFENFQDLREDQEKFSNLLSDLRKIKDQRIYQNLNQIEIDYYNQLANQTETVIKTMETFGKKEQNMFKMLIKEELMKFQSLISRYQQEIKVKDETTKTQSNQNEIYLSKQKIQQKEKDQMQEKDEQTDVEYLGKELKFYHNRNHTAYLKCMVKVIQFQQYQIKEEENLINKLLEEITCFADDLDQIQRFENETQKEYKQLFEGLFKELIKNFEQLAVTNINLSQMEDENFELYLERIKSKSHLSQSANEKQEIIQTQPNISDFLNFLKAYFQEKLAEPKSFSKTLVQQELLIQQIKKLYLQDNQEEEKDEKFIQQKTLLDNLKQKFIDLTNNENLKIKQGLVFTIIQISSNCFTDSIISFCSKTLILFWVSEKDQRVRNLLKNENLINMQMQILKKDWKTQNDRIAGEMEQILKRIDSLKEEIFHEPNINKRDLKLKQLDETTQQLDEYIGKISEMGQQFRLITDFVNFARKALLRQHWEQNQKNFRKVNIHWQQKNIVNIQTCRLNNQNNIGICYLLTNGRLNKIGQYDSQGENQ
ncbi:unnamed protein product [Paramecium sonneborni]|uniref:Uncharacterized protein n=1 Tax=Paramecium sonneborni TaxID=65129 RepID=A0A8S1PKL5_9CILI|nr:unnamed protein product [Paramecium sonneborni]